MSSGKNPLDLNSFPDEYTPGHSERWRGSNQLNTEEASLPAFDALRCRKRKCGVVEGKETCLKVYECRFCSLKFCKSQALGGHMNRHRQERETETLNRARQLVYSNDNMGALNLGLRDQKPGQYFTDSFPHEPSLPYMDSLTMPTPILTQPSPFPSPSPPPPFFSSSPTPPSLASNSPISLPACFLPLHYSSQILPSRMNDLVNRHHVASGSPHRQLQEQQQNSAARDFLSGLARSGEPVGYYQDKRVSWGSTHD